MPGDEAIDFIGGWARPDSAGPTPRDLNLDEANLARRARTTLAGADRGLLITGDAHGQHTLAYPVAVYDEDGEPLLALPEGAAFADIARARRLGRLILEANPTFGVRLTLSGRLSPLDRNSGRLLALSVELVSVGCPHARWDRNGNSRTVSLASYALAEPDLLAAYLPRVTRHLNECHADLVRWLAVYATGIRVDRLAAAKVTSLTAAQLELTWLDATGAHPATLPFLAPLRSLADLTAKLRRLVDLASTGARP